MDDVIGRRLTGSPEPSDEPSEEDSGMNDFGSQLVGGLAGLSALHASGWEPPADLEWQDEQDDWSVAPTSARTEDQSSTSTRTLAVVVGILFLAIVPRLTFLFFVGDPQNAGAGWYGDTYHHWQIAYFTKEVGLSQGFKLWDLKGMEYFWGAAHPLMLTGLFAVTGSTDIVLTRLLSVVAGSISCVLIYLIGRRFWNAKVGIAAAAFAALNPVSVFNNASGMVEPVAIPFLLAGVYFWPRRAWLAGVMWAMASMLRAEYWLFAVGLLGAVVVLSRQSSNRKLGLVLGWSLPMLAYMKFLLDRTGNPIYPIYWSFLGNAAGRWQADVPMGPEQIIGRNAFLIVLAIAIVGVVVTIAKRPRSYLLNLLGFGNLLFLGVFVGLSAYALSYRHYFWFVRIFELPYIILFLLLAALLIWRKESAISSAQTTLGWSVIVLIVFASQLIWIPIMDYYSPTESTWMAEVEKAEEIAALYTDGTLLIPETDPNLTYTLVKYGGLTADRLQGQMYDPFAYFESDPFADWQKYREEILDWLVRDDISMIVFDGAKSDYMEMVRREPRLFHRVGTTSSGNLQIYRVRQ